MSETVTSKQSPPSSPPIELASRRESLERRLDDGFRRIDEAALSGADVSEWESFWIRLLREYEEICRGQDIAA